MEVNVHHAKTHLSKLIAAAESGEEVVIARNGKPAVKLVVIPEKKGRSRREMWGAGIGKLWISPDFHSQQESEEMADLFDPGNKFE